MAFRFPKTVNAAKALERDQWGFANALLDECGPPGKDHARNGSIEKLEAARDELTANNLLNAEGKPYGIDWLRDCRDTAHTFPHGSQDLSVSFRVHLACRTPVMLTAVLKAWRQEKGNQKLALHACTALIAKINQHRTKEWEKKQTPAWAKAKVSLDLAKTSLKTAQERKLAAKTDKERELLDKAIKRATKDKENAKRRMEEHALPPAIDESAVPAETKMPAIMFGMEVQGRASKAVILADEALKLAEKLDSYRQGDDYHALGDEDFEAIVEQARIASDKWRSVADVFQKAHGKKGSHLSVVGGGNA